jgi:adenylyl-sulfate kinase
MSAKPVSTNIAHQELTVKPQERARIKNQKPMCIWFTGLSGSGKTTLANALDEELHKRGFHTALLDGDNIRHGLSSDLGFSPEDRTENLRRVAEVCKLMVDSGLIVIAAFISPLERERAFARSLFADAQFFEVYMSTSLAVCEARDTKGLYQKARQGVLKDFTGIDGVYEVPPNPDIKVNGESEALSQSLNEVMDAINRSILG